MLAARRKITIIIDANFRCLR